MVIRLLLVSAPSWAIIKELQEIKRKVQKIHYTRGLSYDLDVFLRKWE